MTTLRAGYSSLFAPTMADADIDLSSELFERGGDEDIDIDIDVSGDQHDEDYMLEDADDVPVGNDDVMEDDENVSYLMDDVDELPDDGAENLLMEDANAVQLRYFDFASAEMGHVQPINPETSSGDPNRTPEADMNDSTNLI